MSDDALWYEAALLVGLTNALNVVADAPLAVLEPAQPAVSPGGRRSGISPTSGTARICRRSGRPSSARGFRRRRWLRCRRSRTRTG